MAGFFKKNIAEPVKGFFTVRKYSPKTFAASCVFKLVTLLSLVVALYCWTTGDYLLVTLSLALDAYLLYTDLRLLRDCIRERRNAQQEIESKAEKTV